MGFLDEADRRQAVNDEMNDLQRQINELCSTIQDQQAELGELQNYTRGLERRISQIQSGIGYNP